MTIYAVTISTSLAGLNTPMQLSPGTFKRIPPDQIITAARIRVLNGLPAYQLFWNISDPNDTADIMGRTGGEAASSVPGFVRIKDWIPRVTYQETWSDYACILDQPVQGEFRVGSNRYNLMVPCRDLILAQNLAL